MADKRPRTFETQETPFVQVKLPVGDAGPKRPCLVVVAGSMLGAIFPIEGEFIIGRDADLALRLEDDGVSRRHARVTPMEEGALITDLGSANGTFVDGERVSERLLREGMKVRVGQTTVLRFARYDRIEEAAQRQLLNAALRDGLTQAFNRKYFVERLAAELRFSVRHQQKLGLMMIDVDHFKAFNDRLGHPAGDEVLRRLARLLQESLRAGDVLARYGGEEFVVLARALEDDNLQQMCERLRALVESAEIAIQGERQAVTISIGVAGFPFEGAAKDISPEQFIERADAALYRAKAAGRNRVSR